MILLLHIIIASASIGYTAFVYLYPSKSRLRTSYVLVATTVASGFYLVFRVPAHMTQTCITGLVYLAVVSYGIVSARNKFARAANR